MDLFLSAKDEIWFLRVCHHVSNAVDYLACFMIFRKLLFHLSKEGIQINLVVSNTNNGRVVLLPVQSKDMWMQLTSKFDLIWLKQEDMIFFRCLIKHYAIKVYGRFGVYLHLFWIFELDVSRQIYAPAALFPVKEP